MAAAIQASLSEINIQEAQPESNVENNQISKESYDFLSEYAGVKPAQEESKQEEVKVNQTSQAVNNPFT